ncbi:MAG: acyl-CoA thioesterase [Deltaproteobacteria bacterium]|nr:acyl-CoA thioesterase [Deltaproteobacteria bacterium]
MDSSDPAIGTCESRPFRLATSVTDGDLDVIGHANNIAYLRWVQDVAIAHSDAVGLTWDAYRELGAVFVVRRHEIDYLRPALRGDTLELRTWIDSAMAAKCKRGTAIVKTSGGAEVVVARAMTSWGFVEMPSGRPTRIPDRVRLAFGFPVRTPA